MYPSVHQKSSMGEKLENVEQTELLLQASFGDCPFGIHRALGALCARAVWVEGASEAEALAANVVRVARANPDLAFVWGDFPDMLVQLCGLTFPRDLIVLAFASMVSTRHESNRLMVQRLLPSIQDQVLQEWVADVSMTWACHLGKPTPPLLQWLLDVVPFTTMPHLVHRVRELYWTGAEPLFVGLAEAARVRCSQLDERWSPCRSGWCGAVARRSPIPCLEYK
jgi:hypothetical protein